MNHLLIDIFFMMMDKTDFLYFVLFVCINLFLRILRSVSYVMYV